jgi:hypothetical protein
VGGEVRHLRVHCVAEHDENGGVARLVGTVQDVTADQLARLALVDASEAATAASRVKSQFLANISHEIRTPMNAVLGMISLVLDTGLSPEQRTYLIAAKASGDALLGLVNNVLDLSKIEASKLVLEERSLSVREIVADVIGLLAPAARNKGIALVADVDDSVPQASRGDRHRIRQIFINLVANAVKFTDSGEVRTSVRQDGAMLSVRVCDTGIGIAPELLSVVFEPFRQADGSITRRYGGTGLGLSIAAELVRCMRGVIRATSDLGRGSVFEFRIHVPGAHEARMSKESLLPDSAAGEVAAPPPACRPLRVLLAEDDDTNAMLAMALLKRMGHTATRARNGAEAVAAAAQDSFDVILMDVQMPGVDGLEATARIRKREAALGGHVRIIALTANAMKGDEAACLTAGMDAYLSKPIGAALLRNALTRWGALAA